MILGVIESIIYPIIGLTFLLVFIQVVARFVFQFAMPWVYELVLFLMAFVTFLGSANGIHEDTHARISLFLMKFPQKMRFVIYVLIDILIIWFTAIVAIEGYKIAVFSIPQITPGLSISLFWPYLSLPLGGGLMCTIQIINMTELLVTKKMPEPDSLVIRD